MSYEIRTRSEKKIWTQLWRKVMKLSFVQVQGAAQPSRESGVCSLNPLRRRNDRNETITLEENAEALEQPHTVAVRTVKSAVMN